MRNKPRSERNQLELFRCQANSRRATQRISRPIRSSRSPSQSWSYRSIFRAGEISIRVGAVPGHSVATIWDVLIWAASRIVEARDAG